MIPLIISLAYALVALFVARHLFQKAVKGGFEVDTTARIAVGVAVSLLYSLAWPLLLLGLGILGFIVRRAKTGQT
jgi:hypothetical protein